MANLPKIIALFPRSIIPATCNMQPVTCNLQPQYCALEAAGAFGLEVSLAALSFVVSFFVSVLVVLLLQAKTKPMAIKMMNNFLIKNILVWDRFGLTK